MDRKLYVTTKPYTDGAQLIGILYENGGKYRFQYKLGGVGRGIGCIISGVMGDKNGVCMGEAVQKFIDRYVPYKGERWYKLALEHAGLDPDADHDLWVLLTIFGKRGANNGGDKVYLHDKLPEDAVLYEDIGEHETFSCHKDCAYHNNTQFSREAPCDFGRHFLKKRAVAAREAAAE